MNAKTLLLPLAVGRVLVGIGFLVAPEPLSRGWIGKGAARKGGTRLMTRAVGARDLAMGLGALTANEPSLRGWAAAGAVSDTADLIATLAADDIPNTGRLAVAGIAAASAAVGIAGALKGGGAEM